MKPEYARSKIYYVVLIPFLIFFVSLIVIYSWFVIQDTELGQDRVKSYLFNTVQSNNSFILEELAVGSHSAFERRLKDIVARAMVNSPETKVCLKINYLWPQDNLESKDYCSGLSKKSLNLTEEMAFQLGTRQYAHVIFGLQTEQNLEVMFPAVLVKGHAFAFLAAIVFTLLLASQIRKFIIEPFERNIRNNERNKLELDMRKEIASQVVHDIKSPIGALKSLTDCKSVDESQNKILLNQIYQRLVGIVDDLEKKEDVEAKQFPICSLVEKLVLEKNTELNGFVRICLKVDDEQKTSHCSCIGNKNEFARAFSNLVNNAVEASSQGQEIKIGISKHNRNAIIEIVDSGKGMTKEEARCLGEKGFTLGKAEGRGLGVYYAKKVVSSMNGQLAFQSAPNKGTKVTIEIPTVG